MLTHDTIGLNATSALLIFGKVCFHQMQFYVVNTVKLVKIMILLECLKYSLLGQKMI